ncbi:triple tyrosine motif-containing protein [Clostridium sp. SYSU_GA19001]|uniref:triple tyrosine motif-containing protein n=1 Tax=Clostridium caldaquaticum TaxID=2940653 RepID=UPI0020773807|nr:triple tyrosine motif-containing protein [Clostridium caldaquaticum]MCM8711875.1 triple tyrosine motif-containing protein [Clostridium caldaquaticum]
MNEIVITFDLESPQQKNTEINISISKIPDNNLLYKFMVGFDGTWETLKDFGTEEKVTWIPKNDGKYVIMVQAKKKGSSRSFDYVSRAEYTIGKDEERLINSIYLDKTSLKVGDKLNLTVEAKKIPAVFRYWIREKENWELLKDYSAENSLSFSVKDSGEQEILVECKALDSKNRFDDSQKVKFYVNDIKKVEITDFKCLITDLIADNELIFQVEAVYEDNRMILYKFIKINPDGSTQCIQDYSTKRIVCFTEKQGGDYKLLCLAKDMYSPREYDDRALLNYKVKPYRDIVIQSFTSDLSSPQVCETTVNLKAVVSGGKELLYRFKIDGNYGEDSGYTRNDNYTWNTKKPGEYKIELWVKDISFEGTYEKSASMNFTVDEQCKEPIVINEVILDRKNKILKGETINVKIIASGGIELRYSFHVKKNGKEVEKIDFGTCNWVNFTPEEKGKYELEARVKDKYSKRDYDSHSVIYVEVYDYMPAVIDYVLLPARENYIVGDSLTYTVIAQNTKKILLKYVLSINGHKVEETDYVKDKKYAFTPKCSGAYSLEIYAKNEDSDKEFDCKKEINLKVYDALPITNTKIQCDKIKAQVNEVITFSAACEGGKDVLYEFYIMEKGDWILAQNYSKKNYYSFMPFSSGTYRVLVLCKSSLRKCSYEDYGIFEFTVE